MNVYQLSARYEQLLDQDEYTEAEMIELESLHDSVEDECIERGKYIRNLEAEASMIDQAISEMKARSAQLALKADRQREKLIARMQSFDIKKITKSPLFALCWKENPVSVDDYDKALIPEKFWVVKVSETKSISKDAVKKAIESGEEVPGAKLVRKVKLEFK